MLNVSPLIATPTLILVLFACMFVNQQYARHNTVHYIKYIILARKHIVIAKKPLLFDLFCILKTRIFFLYWFANKTNDHIDAVALYQSHDQYYHTLYNQLNYWTIIYWSHRCEHHCCVATVVAEIVHLCGSTLRMWIYVDFDLLLQTRGLNDDGRDFYRNAS